MLPSLLVGCGSAALGFPAILRFELTELQVDHDERAQAQVIEEQVDIEVLVADRDAMLAIDDANPWPSSSRKRSRWRTSSVSSSRSWNGSVSVVSGSNTLT
jgi:hypothetical protein